jgi:hypothetical protein
MEDDVDALKHSAQALPIRDIPRDKVHLRTEISRSLSPLSVNLRVQVVQHTDPMALPQQSIHQMRTDKTGPSGNQSAYHTTHPILIRQPTP